MYVVGVCECEWGGVVGLRPLHTDDTLHLLVWCGVYVLCICVVCVLCMCCVCVVFFLNCVSMC